MNAAILDAFASELATRVADLLAVKLAPPTVFETRSLTRDQAAKALRVSKSTLDRAVRRGAPVHHVGKRRRFDLDELRGWFEARGKAAIDDGADEVGHIARRNGLRVKGKRHAAGA